MERIRWLPSEQRVVRDEIRRDIKRTGDSSLMGSFFKGYFSLLAQSEVGNGCTVDPRMIEALYNSFVDIIGSKKDVNIILDEWKKARDKRNAGKPESL